MPCLAVGGLDWSGLVLGSAILSALLDRSLAVMAVTHRQQLVERHEHAPGHSHGHTVMHVDGRLVAPVDLTDRIACELGRSQPPPRPAVTSFGGARPGLVGATPAASLFARRAVDAVGRAVACWRPADSRHSSRHYSTCSLNRTTITWPLVGVSRYSTRHRRPAVSNASLLLTSIVWRKLYPVESTVHRASVCRAS